MKSEIRYAKLSFIEARPCVQGIYMLRFAAGTLLGGPVRLLHPATVLAGAFGWFCATVAIYVYNGVADRVEDTANGSTRPIASGALPVRTAARAVVALTLISVLIGVSLGVAQTVVVTLYLLVGYAYSGPPFPLKRAYYATMPAALLLSGTTYVAGGLASGRAVSPPYVIFVAASAAWTAFVGGISKDLSDVAGDCTAGRRSLPIVIGARGARVATAMAAAAVAAGFIAMAAVYAEELVWSASAMLLGALAVTVAAVRIRDDCLVRKYRRRPYMAFMCTQHLSHLVLLCSPGAY